MISPIPVCSDDIAAGPIWTRIPDDEWPPVVERVITPALMQRALAEEGKELLLIMGQGYDYRITPTPDRQGISQVARRTNDNYYAIR